LSEPVREEIEPSGPDYPGENEHRIEFLPLATLPHDVPKAHRRFWEKLAAQAETSYMAAIQLKCLDCCAWVRMEAVRCQIGGCPLWAFNRRIFRVRKR
jgi:hypothetical protein